MYLRFISLLYFWHMGQVYATSGNKCTALNNRPLETCTNLFHHVNFTELKDRDKRQARRSKKCKKGLKSLYELILPHIPKPPIWTQRPQIIMHCMPGQVCTRPPPVTRSPPATTKPPESVDDLLAWMERYAMTPIKPIKHVPVPYHLKSRPRRDASQSGVNSKTGTGSSKHNVNSKVGKRPFNRKPSSKARPTKAPTRTLRPGIEPSTKAATRNSTIKIPRSSFNPSTIAATIGAKRTTTKSTRKVTTKTTNDATTETTTRTTLTAAAKTKIHLIKNRTPVPYECKKVYTGTVVDLMPFTYQMMRAIDVMLKRCCGNQTLMCAYKSLAKMSHVDEAEIGYSSMVFPVLGRTVSHDMNGYYFIPIYDAPGAYFFSKKQSKSKITKNIVSACENLWPLLTICLLLALISGFVVWCIETRKNELEFPRPFHVGMFEGFWWSFISMSTVGYGDKAPKSLAGRIFSMIWILVGITICSMFTASLTTEISKWSTTPTPLMSGKKIGVLKHRLLDALIVAKQGGIIKEIDHDGIPDGMETMIQMLQNDTIEGFSIDIMTYHYFVSWKDRSRIIGNMKKYASTIRNLVRTEVFYEGEKLSFGVLFKDENDFEYFQSYFTNNVLFLEACYYLQMNARSSESADLEFLFDPRGGLFYKLLYYIVGVLGLIAIFGAGYELRRYQLKKGRVGQQSTMIHINELK